MRSRWCSRKFLLSLAAQVAALAVLIWPQYESEIVQICQTVTALLVMMLSALGYVQAEGAIDRAAAVGEPSESKP